jgi:kynurenine 3-monooxygenase
MEKIAIIGAGLVGSLQAIYLAKKGYKVDIYEGREDMRRQDISAGRSINLALSDRGWKALEAAGIKEEIAKTAIPMKGRIMHDTKGNTTFQPYGKEGEAIFSVSRGGLNKTLMDCAEAYENVNIHFSRKCKDIDLKTNTLLFENTETGEELSISADRIFATDGAFSAIRARLQKTDRFDYEQKYLKHGYKELSIPPTADGGFKLDPNALHIWPRGEFMLIALGNEDGSFTCTLFFPFEGENSFESLKTKEQVNTFFAKVFPDALKLMPQLEEEYFNNPTSSLVTVRCSPWHYGDRVVLMGDASHAIVPFYGQGMNSGFEDCTVFDGIFEEANRNWESAFLQFSQQRKQDTDAIADLALQNFIEMRDLVADQNFLLRKKIEKKIFEKHPDKWMPLYSQVTFSHIPYSEALSNGKRQERIMDCIMAKPDIHTTWDSPEIEKEIIDMVTNA